MNICKLIPVLAAVSALAAAPAVAAEENTRVTAPGATVQTGPDGSVSVRAPGVSITVPGGAGGAAVVAPGAAVTASPDAAAESDDGDASGKPE